MKILFTILSIEDNSKMYLTSAKTLTQEILNQTNHDVLISTNNIDFFSDIQSNRVIVRDSGRGRGRSRNRTRDKDREMR